jgi:hypothetical protein
VKADAVYTAHVPLILRGETIEDRECELSARRGGVKLLTAAVHEHLERLPLARPSAMADLELLRCADVVEFLARLGERCAPDRNPHLQTAFECSRFTSGLSAGVLRHQYEQLPRLFEPAFVTRMIERGIGAAYLDSWVPEGPATQAGRSVSIRAFGTRALHVIAGNAPGIAALSIVRNAITRSDALIKAPSNDPLTAAAIARTMIGMAPDHPLTRHLAVACWKGGDERIEPYLFDSRRMDKIVAWGGLATIRNALRGMQPGLDLIAFEPKISMSILGAQAFQDDSALNAAARRLAQDIGALDQEACFSSRIAYAVCGTDAAGVARAQRLGKLTFEALQALPTHVCAPRRELDPALKAELDALRIAGEEYVVYGGRPEEGAVIVCSDSAPIDFANLLSGRTANIVPVDDLDSAIRSIGSETQTVGIYPESLKPRIRNRLAQQGVQRIVSLGAAASSDAGWAPAQDGIEPMRRMCRWVVEEPPAVGEEEL